MQYDTIAATTEAELEISRSRFLTHLARVSSEAEAREVIARIRELHPKARHHCTAFVLGPGQRTQRSSDDGEPSGTAGAPMLDALVSAGLSDVVAVVTRYFGGVLLGAGGLTRAYRAAVAEAVAKATRVTRAERTEVRVRSAYDTAATLEAEARRRGFGVGAAVYGQDVDQPFMVDRDDIQALTALAAEVSAGAAVVTIGATDYIDL